MRVLKQIDSLTKEQAVEFLTNIGIFETGTDLRNEKGGRYQMLESFREQMSKDTGINIDKEFVNDPYKASALLINHLVNNFGNETELMDYYYEHHFGNKGKGLRDRSRSEPITNVFTSTQIKNNPYLIDKNLRTVGDFIDYWEGPKREQTDKMIRDGKIQYMLKDLGYYFKNIDHDIYERGATARAMKQFMEEKGLDKEDLEYLSEIYQKIPRESRIAYSRFGTLRDVNPVQASNMGEVASDIYDMMSRNNFDLEKTLPIVEKYGRAFEEGKVTNFLDIRDKVDMGFSYEDAIENATEKSRVRDATMTEGAQILTPIDSSLEGDITKGPIDNETHTQFIGITNYQDGGKIGSKEWMKQWYNHPETRRRLERDFGQTALGEVQSNIDDLELIRANGIGEYSSALGKQYRKTMNPLAARRAESQRALGSKGVYFRDDNIAITQGSPSTEVHEIAHATGLDRKYIDLVPEGQRVVDNRELVERKADSIARQRVGTDGKIIRTKGGGRLHREKLPWGISHLDRALNPNSRLAGYSRTSKSVLSDREFEDIRDKNRLKGIRVDYLNKSEEVYPRIMEIRHRNNIKPGEVIDDAKIEEIYQNDNNAIFDIYSKEQVKELLNNLASVNTNNDTPIYAKKGGRISKTKQ